MGQIARKYFRWATHGDYAPLTKYRDMYHGVMVEAHMVAALGRQFESGLARLAKPYFVDPHTYVLSIAQKVSKCQTGGWDRSMVERIDGAGGRGALGTRIKLGPLSPSDFGVGGSARRGGDLTVPLVEGTICIQKGPNQSITEHMGGAGPGGGPLAPEFTLAPYFYAPDTASEWFSVNELLLNEAARQEAGVYGVLCLGQGVLGDDGAASRICEAYSEAGGLLVWLSGFDDTKASASKLGRYNLLVDALADTGKPIIALHAGHYATMLSTRIAIRGVVRGLDMNGCKDAMGSGGPGQNRYYLRQPHTHAPMGNAARALLWGRKMRCSCSPCNAALSAARQDGHARGDLYGAMLDGMNQVGLKEHFMHAQKSEMDHVGANSSDVTAMALGELSEADLGRLEEVGVTTEHIRRWRSALPR